MNDVSMQSTAERFEAFKTHSEQYAFLYEFEEFGTRFDSGRLLHSCESLEKSLSRDEVSDIDANELCNELRILSKLIKVKKIDHLIDILNLIKKPILKVLCRM